MESVTRLATVKCSKNVIITLLLRFIIRVVVDTVSGCALITTLRAAFTSFVWRTLVSKATRGGRVAEPALLHISILSLYEFVWVLSNASQSVEIEILIRCDCTPVKSGPGWVLLCFQLSLPSLCTHNSVISQWGGRGV